jgi:general secretion pathway protein G
MQAAKILEAFRLYRLEAGAYPNESDGLDALSRPLVRGIPVMDTVPRDAWGQPFHYALPAGADEPLIISFGRDGRPGGGDDITPTTDCPTGCASCW